MTTRSRHVPAGLRRKLIKTISFGDFTAATSNSFENGNQFPAGAIPRSWAVVCVETFFNENTDLLMNIESLGSIPQANSINLSNLAPGDVLKISAIPDVNEPWEDQERAEMTIVADDEVTLLNTTTAGQLQVWGFYEFLEVPDQTLPFIVSATLQENNKDVLVQWSEHVHMVGNGQFQLSLEAEVTYYWNPDSVEHNSDQTLLRFGEQLLDDTAGTWTLTLFDNFGHFEDDGANWCVNQSVEITPDEADPDETAPNVVEARFFGAALNQVLLSTDEKLTYGSNPDPSTITFGGIAGLPECTGIAVNWGSYVDTDAGGFDLIAVNYTTIGLSAGLAPGDTAPTMSFTLDEDPNPLKDLAGIPLDDFAALPIQIPAQQSGAFGAGTNIWAWWTINVIDDEPHTPLLAAFALKKLDGSPAEATLTAINGWDGEQNYLEFETDIEVDWAHVRLVYTKPLTKKLTDIIGREVDSFSVIVYED